MTRRPPSPRDLAVLIEAWWTLLWLDWRIRRQPYHKWRPLLDSRLDNRIESEAGRAGQRLIRLAEIAARHHLRPMNCLRRTLAEKRLLERRGIACHVHIGVNREKNSGLAAHAWLSDRHGDVLNDSSDVIERYYELMPDNWAGAGFSDSD